VFNSLQTFLYLRGGNYQMANQPTKYRKFLAGAATASLVATAVVPSALAAVTFSDVPATDTHYENISKAVSLGLFKGKIDGTFGPYENISRGQVAKVLANYVVNQEGLTYATYIEKHNLTKTVTPFNDVPSTHADSELFNASLIVKSSGIFTGSNNNLMPTKFIVRQQMAKVLVNGFGLKDLPGDLSKVTDNKSAFAEFVPFIDILSENGVTVTEAFRPTSNVVRGQMASFLNRAYEIANPMVVAPGISSVSAINATTVEVTYKEAVSDIKASDYSIQGLTVSNAAVKQTNDKVVVLTTSTQEGAKEYTVKSGENTLGKFNGISAVIPTSIKLLTSNTQAKVGSEVTLTADIGVKAAGVPVTFNVDAPTGSLNKDAVVEVVTNVDGIASYSYTQYAAAADDVTVYPTGAPQLRAFGTVYWGVDNILNIEEVTPGNVQANGVNKTYKVTYKDPKTGVALTNRKLNVSFVENTNVAFNAISKATVTNPTTAVTVNPYQTTTDILQEIEITTDSNGQATFIVSGTNTSVTPYVFVDGSNSVLGTNIVTGTDFATNANNKWEATELTATAATVKFEGAQLTNQITVERAGEEEAAAVYGSKLNGREYNVKVLDKDGKAYANGIVNVALDEEIDKNVTTSSTAKFTNVKDSTAIVDGNNTKQIQLKLDSKGEAKVVLYGADNVTGTPVVWIDQNVAENDQSGVLEDSEPFFKAPVTNFQFERVIGGNLTLEGKADKNQTIAIDGIADYEFFLTNQSGKDLTNQEGKLSYVIRNTSGQPITVTTDAAYTKQDGSAEATSFDIAEYGSITITRQVTTQAESKFAVTTVGGEAGSVLVTPSFVTTNAFDASNDNGTTTDARDYSKFVTDAGLTATFGNGTEVGTNYTGIITNIDKTNKEITFDTTKAPVKYAGETGKTYNYDGIGSTPIIGADAFIAELESNAGKTIRATYKVVDNVVSFYIVSYNDLGIDKLTLNTAILDAETAAADAVEGTNPGEYDLDAINTYTAAVDAAREVYDNPNATQIEVEEALTTLATATTAFNDAEVPAEVPAEVDFAFTTTEVTGNSLALQLGMGTFKVAGIVAAADLGETSEVVLTFTGGTDNTATTEVNESITTKTVTVLADGTFSFEDVLNNTYKSVSAKYSVVDSADRTLPATTITEIK
jgi:hypothetical protein